MNHVRSLVFVLIMLSNERRVAEDIAALFRRQNFFPVEPECIGAMNVRRFLERQALVKLAEGGGDFLVHLMIHEPERDFRNPHRPFQNLDAMKLIHVDDGQELLATDSSREFTNDFNFQSADFAVSENKEIAATTSRVEKLK